MHTKGLPRRSRADLEADIGKPDAIDEHPLIRCTPTLMGGHAHLKRNDIVVERVLEALLRERRPGPLVVGTRSDTITDDEAKAVVRYAVAIFGNISKLYAELDRLHRIIPKAIPK